MTDPYSLKDARDPAAHRHHLDLGRLLPDGMLTRHLHPLDHPDPLHYLRDADPGLPPDEMTYLMDLRLDLTDARFELGEAPVMKEKLTGPVHLETCVVPRNAS